MYKNAANSGSQDDWVIFRNCKKATSTILRESKRNYIVNSINQNRTDPKRFWQEVGENFGIGKGSNKARLCKVRDINGIVQEGVSAANSANTYYASMGTNLDMKFTSKWEPNNFLKALNDANITLSFSFITEKVVLINRQELVILVLC